MKYIKLLNTAESSQATSLPQPSTSKTDSTTFIDADTVAVAEGICDFQPSTSATSVDEDVTVAEEIHGNIDLLQPSASIVDDTNETKLQSA